LDVTSGRVYISRDVVFDENVFPFASLHPNAGRRLTQDILLLPTSHNACTHGDTQSDVHMPLPVIHVVTNLAQDTTPHTAAEDHEFEDDHTGENLSENDEETSENNSILMLQKKTRWAPDPRMILLLPRTLTTPIPRRIHLPPASLWALLLRSSSHTRPSARRSHAPWLHSTSTRVACPCRGPHLQ
jgi:hypothetical protein